MKLNRKEFLDIIESVIPAISKTSYNVKQGDCLVFMDNKLITYNDSISIFYPLDFEITGAVKALEFHKVIKTLKSEYIDMSITDDGILIATSEKGKVTGRTTVKLSSEVMLPINNIPEADTWKLLPDNFLTGLKLCATTTVKNTSDPICNYILIDSNEMLATETYRIIQYHLSSCLDRFYIPADIVNRLVSYNPTHVSIQYDWILFKNEKNVIFATRTIDKDEAFPIVSKIEDKVNEDQFSVEELCDFQGYSLKLPDNISEGLSICKILSGKSEEKVKLFGGLFYNFFCNGKQITHKETNDVNTQRGSLKPTDVKIGDSLNKTFKVDNITTSSVMYISSSGDIGKHQQKFEIPDIESFDFTISPTVLMSAMKLNPTFTINPENGLKIENKDFTHFVCILDE